VTKTQEIEVNMMKNDEKDAIIADLKLQLSQLSGAVVTHHSKDEKIKNLL